MGFIANRVLTIDDEAVLKDMIDRSSASNVVDVVASILFKEAADTRLSTGEGLYSPTANKLENEAFALRQIQVSLFQIEQSPPPFQDHS